jgi:lipoprotein-anchoring transpeptidase ErfK/SrfK
MLLIGMFMIMFALEGDHLRNWLASRYSFQNVTASELKGEITDEKVAEFEGQKIPVPSLDFIADIKRPANVLGQSNGNKRIEVDLTNQRVYAYDGDNLVYYFIVSTGKWGRTPTGDFRIDTKLVATKMSGGSHALHTYYYLPNVPWVMFFGNQIIPASRGFSFHGTYWHNNFGHPMSHGCINMRTEDAKTLYDWADPATSGRVTKADQENPGTEVIIYGVTPSF